MISSVSDFPLLLSVAVALTRAMFLPGIIIWIRWIQMGLDGSARYNDMELTDRDGSGWQC